MTQKDQKENFAELLEKYGTDNFEEFIKEKDEDSQEEKIRKNLKKIEPVHIQAEIDLHSQNRYEAIENAEDFIDRSRQNNFSKILIVTGKGSGTLRQAVKELLDEMKQSGKIDRYKNAPQELGEQGAFVVILN